MDTRMMRKHVETEEIHVYRKIEGNSSTRSKSIFGPKFLCRFRKLVMIIRNSLSASAVVTSFW